MASFMIQLSKSLFVIIANSKASCLHHECEPCPSYVFSFLEPSLFYLQCAFIRASSFDCSPAFGASLGPPGLPRLLSFVSGELSVHRQSQALRAASPRCRDSAVARSRGDLCGQGRAPIPAPVQWKREVVYVRIWSHYSD